MLANSMFPNIAHARHKTMDLTAFRALLGFRQELGIDARVRLIRTQFEDAKRVHTSFTHVHVEFLFQWDDRAYRIFHKWLLETGHNAYVWCGVCDINHLRPYIPCSADKFVWVFVLPKEATAEDIERSTNKPMVDCGE